MQSDVRLAEAIKHLEAVLNLEVLTSADQSKLVALRDKLVSWQVRRALEALIR